MVKAFSVEELCSEEEHGLQCQMTVYEKGNDAVGTRAALEDYNLANCSYIIRHHLYILYRCKHF